MKQSKKVALCGVMTALSVVIMLAAYFPYLTFALLLRERFSAWL